MEQKKDIFDRIMGLPVFRSVRPLYVKHKSVLLYIFFGGLTTFVSIGSFALCNMAMESWLDEVLASLLANIFSWVAAVSFAYVTNRIWVFPSQEKGIGMLREIGAFFGGRLATLALEEGILYVGITLATMDALWVKLLAQVVVLVLNYVISKLLVFRKKNV